MTRDRLNHRSVPLLALLGLGVPISAQPEIDWWSVDGGGETTVVGDFEVTGSIGQVDADAMSGGDFTVTGGFWTSKNPFVPVELLYFFVDADSAALALPRNVSGDFRVEIEADSTTKDAGQPLLGVHSNSEPLLDHEK